MIRPGDQAHQAIYAGADFASIPAACGSLLTRQTPTAFYKMQRPKNHKRWEWTESVEFLDQAKDFSQPIGAEGGEGTAYFEPDNPITHFLYRCTPGKGVTQVRLNIGLEVDSAVDGSVLAKRSYSWPVQIERQRFIVRGVHGPC